MNFSYDLLLKTLDSLQFPDGFVLYGNRSKKVSFIVHDGEADGSKR
jgi:hypothetical protein